MRTVDGISRLPVKKMNEELKYAIEHGMIDLSYVQEQIKMNKRNELLKKHPYTIWEGKNGYWHTYLPKSNGERRLIKKKNEQDIKDEVIKYWGSIKTNNFKNRYEIWIKRQESCGRSDNTICKYKSDYIRFFKGDKIEDMDIKYISDEDISLFIKRLLTEKEIPYRALKSLMGYLSGVFDKAVIDKIITKNPCKYVDLPMYKQYCTETEKKTAEQRTLSFQEKKVMLNKISKKDTIVKYAVELAMYTGMRVGELAGLKWCDIDYTLNYITVCRSEKHNRKTNEYYISTTKNDKVRKIPLTENMKLVFDKIKKDSARKGFLGEFVFTDETGKIHTSRISDFARNNTMSSEFTGIKSIHTIRRTLNSNMRCLGVPVTIAASILGHTEKVNEENYTYDVSSMDEKMRYIEQAGKIV